ncbi:hypothetical protein [Streptomyces sp. NPDC057382]|uniref:hypothetical protein n=1 Tax=unclassified Streptomyces TaxID=2593676 RepID=UPI003634ADEB
MTKHEPNGATAGPEGWDFRLDRSGLMIAAGRYLQLRVSLGLLFILIGMAVGWSTVQLEWLSL